METVVWLTISSQTLQSGRSQNRKRIRRNLFFSLSNTNASSREVREERLRVELRSLFVIDVCYHPFRNGWKCSRIKRKKKKKREETNWIFQEICRYGSSSDIPLLLLSRDPQYQSPNSCRASNSVYVGFSWPCSHCHANRWVWKSQQQRTNKGKRVKYCPCE